MARKPVAEKPTKSENHFSLISSVGETCIRRVMRIRAVAEVLLVHEVTVWRYVKDDPDFPKPIRIGKHSIAFYEDEVAGYIASRPRTSEAPVHNTGKPVNPGKRRASA